MQQGKKAAATPARRVEKNFKWTRAMTRVMVAGLVEQAALGMKVDKGFKRRAYAAVAQQVTDRFGEECFDNNVENRFKTLKRNWAEIRKLRCAAGCAAFDEATKTVLLPDAAAAEYLQANPKAEPFINQPIELYDELGIICGDERPSAIVLSGEGATPLAAMEEEDDHSLQGSETPSPPPAAGEGRRGKRARRRRDSGLEEKLEMLVEKIGYVAEQMGRDRKKEHADAVHEAVVGCKGYTEEALMDAYGHLLDHNTQANVFLRSSAAMRRRWLQEYFARRYPS